MSQTLTKQYYIAFVGLTGTSVTICDACTKCLESHCGAALDMYCNMSGWLSFRSYLSSPLRGDHGYGKEKFHATIQFSYPKCQQLVDELSLQTAFRGALSRPSLPFARERALEACWQASINWWSLSFMIFHILLGVLNKNHFEFKIQREKCSLSLWDSFVDLTMKKCEREKSRWWC